MVGYADDIVLVVGVKHLKDAKQSVLIRYG